jgi:hypothetical protein
MSIQIDGSAFRAGGRPRSAVREDAMKLRISGVLAIAAFVVSCPLTLSASAQTSPSPSPVTMVTTRPSVNPDGSANNDAIDYGQFNVPSGTGNGTQLPLPQPFESFGGIQGEIGESVDQYVINRQCCQSNLGGGFTANFGIGDWLVYPNPQAIQQQQPPHVTITFKKGVSLVGAQLAQYSEGGAFTGKIQVFDRWGRLLGTFFENGNNFQTFDNAAIFLGVASTTPNIVRVVYTTTDPAGNSTLPVINFLSVRQ